MITIRSIADASVECVTDDRTTSKIGRIYPEVVVALRLNSIIQCVEGDSRFYETGEVVRVDIKYLAHTSPEIQYNGAPDPGSSAAISN